MADQKQEAAPKSQTFNLKEAETRVLQIVQANNQSSFAAQLSLIAQERLGYKVTEYTQFTLNKEFTEMQLTELEPQVPVANAKPEQSKKPEAPASGAVPAK